MASSFQGVLGNLMVLAPAARREKAEYSEIYNEHCHRIYSLAFYLTDNELTAEQVAANTFLRAFSSARKPATEHVDQAFVTEAREFMPIGTLTLNPVASNETTNIRGNVKRVHLERAVVQLPATEKLVFLFHDVEGYQHKRIAALLGLSEEESVLALHNARVQIRELLAQQIG
ncbi:MAG TPA: sigma factor-like helix-turn-helix DNA-binding protein [Candidatus Acidoferrales bacterium]|jgi:DNA-directed RNA polymerase specialized sigma24 family protein|nr:sigma factor-like helix-turn-helix DNA-binding protein [Candidatus Acidoferrales bacterium]